MRNAIKGPAVAWIDIQNPTKDDVQYLKETFSFHPLVLNALIPRLPRPKIEYYLDYLFISLQYPIYDDRKRETRFEELDIIVTKDTVITNHYRSISPLKNLFDLCNLQEELKKNYMSGSSGLFLFYILDSFWRSCVSQLEWVDKAINEIEKKIFRGKEKEMVLEISYIKTDIIDFWRIIEPQGEILESLTDKGKTFFNGHNGENIAPYFYSVLQIYGQAWNSLKTYKETIWALEKTNQSLLSTKTNETIKILTLFSGIMLPLTFLASIWGMNLKLPFAEHKSGFLIVATIMLTVMALMFLYFRKRKWL